MYLNISATEGRETVLVYSRWDPPLYPVKQKEICFSSFCAYFPCQPQFHKVLFHQLIIITIIIISTASGRCLCMSQEARKLWAAIRARAGSHLCAEGEIPFNFMLGWRFVRCWMLPPWSLCVVVGAEVWGDHQPMAMPCVDRAWPVRLQPVIAGLSVTSLSAHSLARRSQTGSSLFFLFSWTRRKPGKRTGIPDLPWEQLNIVCMVMKGTKPQNIHGSFPPASWDTQKWGV